MKLHLQRDAFEAIVLMIQEREGIRADVLEKDYYVSLILKELSEKQSDLKAYFKGGTALYKALNSINSFSEDIDLTVSLEGCTSKTQEKKRLEKSAEDYTCLPRLFDDAENRKNKQNITTIYGYEPIFKEFIEDPLQRFGRVKVEATSFTVSEPTETMVIAPVIYEKSNKDEKKILEEVFGVSPFSIITIKLERIFIDKIFAAESYYRKYIDSSLPEDKRTSAAFDVSKHIYDLMVLIKNKRIELLLSDEEMLKQIISYKRREDEVRIDGIEASHKIKDFLYLDKILYDEEFLKVYEKMQEVYVLDESDKIPLNNAVEVIQVIKGIHEG